MGKAKQGSLHLRLILVVFDSIESKHSVMKNLAGTNIYVNNDLTKEQLAKDKQLRNKKHLVGHPNFGSKRITIYRGELCVDGQPISTTDLEMAGLSK